MIHAKRERTAKEKSPDIAHDDASYEREPIHACATPAEDECAKKIAMEGTKGGVGLQEEIPVKHAQREDDGECAAEAVRPLQGWIGGKTEKRHKRWGRKKN